VLQQNYDSISLLAHCYSLCHQIDEPYEGKGIQQGGYISMKCDFIDFFKLYATFCNQKSLYGYLSFH